MDPSEFINTINWELRNNNETVGHINTTEGDAHKQTAKFLNKRRNESVNVGCMRP